MEVLDHVPEPDGRPCTGGRPFLNARCRGEQFERQRLDSERGRRVRIPNLSRQTSSERVRNRGLDVIDAGQQRTAGLQRLRPGDGIRLNNDHARARSAEVVAVSLTRRFREQHARHTGLRPSVHHRIPATAECHGDDGAIVVVRRQLETRREPDIADEKPAVVGDSKSGAAERDGVG